jgi:hypothetical protein
MPSALKELVFATDNAEIRRILRDIAFRGHATAEELEALKMLADPATPFLNSRELWKHQVVKVEALVALAAVGACKDPAVLDWISHYERDYLARLGPGLYYLKPVGVLVLTALNEGVAVPHLKALAENAPLWSLRIAGLYRLPESRQNGTCALIDEFREWIQRVDFAAEPRYSHSSWEDWRHFMSCLTMDGLRRLLGQDQQWPTAPLAHFSPLVDWALDHGGGDWLVGELDWLRKRASIDVIPVRNRMVERAVPGAVEFCLEQVRRAKPEDYTHYDVVHNVLRLHPRPLPMAALNACLEVIRHPSHPAKFEHRVDAVNWLVEAASEGRYPRGEVENLVLNLAQNEPDPDVRVAAIGFLSWAAPQQLRQVLTGALAHQSVQVREAALRALGQGKAQPV